MKFGICITAAPAPAFLDHTTIVEIARKAEAWGYDSIFLTDHYMTPNYVETYAVLPFLSYLAAETSTLRLGTVVTPIPFRPPGILAKMISTMDILSNGRIILGIGAGWCQTEFEAYSQWDSNRIRVKKTLEGLKLMLQLWNDEKVDFQGEYYQAKGAVLQPKPIQKPHPPLWFGTVGEYMLKLTARYGDGWLPWCTLTPEQYKEKVQILRHEAAKVGRQDKLTYAGVIGQITTTALGHFKRHPPVFNWTDTVEGYIEAGCEYALLYFHPYEYLSLMKKFTEDVLPSF
ncbi:MAG: LLM class flavin-dependent oxidoreductase [Candidatus Bathyarchaeota archaeon]|jgi:alkanesulfonate monooxygenase SsuD/methylene tetrahydromethanopterin reductase-like flavin-dependent oxidoreductase (luciferase family)|nr:LLM class flavin-dependent oxidoreductase [Candidatus Bathyarchaeota archaeon]